MDEVLELLQAWGLPELQTVFIKNEITIQALAALSQLDIKELIPQLGPRALFLRCWKVWQADFTETTDDSLSISAAANLTSCNISLSDIQLLSDDHLAAETIEITQQVQVEPPLVNDKADSECIAVIEDTNLMKILKENFDTLGLLKFIGKSLDNDNARNLLASTICKEILKENKNSPVTKGIYHKWTKEIKAIFPTERITTYYIPPCVTAQGITYQARGKLVSQLLNLRRKYQKQGVLEVKKEKKLGALDQTTVNALSPSLRRLPLSGNVLQNTSNVSEDLAWLKNTSEPWDLVQLKWAGTLKIRFNNLEEREYSVEQYFRDYPALQKPQGYKLLVNDFNTIYSEYMNNLYLNFPTLKVILLNLLKKKQSRDNYYNDIIHLGDGTDEENTNLAAILTLPELINPSIVALPRKAPASTSSTNNSLPTKKRKLKENKWKPTKAESREAFINHIQDDSYLQLIIRKRHTETTEKGFTPQPYIVIIGPNIFNIKSYFVVINPNTFYNCPNILTSIDTCFKITWALNLEYSPSSYGPWFFLQKAIYKLSSPHDKGSTSVESLLTDCNLTNS